LSQCAQLSTYDDSKIIADISFDDEEENEVEEAQDEALEIEEEE
jgi:hypothetical protein